MVVLDPKVGYPGGFVAPAADPAAAGHNHHHEQKYQHHSYLHDALAGTSSGCVTRFLCHPLDVLKIRFQLQVEPITRGNSASKYRSVTQTFTCIVREEGVTALWKGHVSAQILSGIYGSVYFSSFDYFSELANGWLASNRDHPLERSRSNPPLVNFFCGSLAGFCSQFFSNPFDVVRTRIISQSEAPKTYLNTRHAFRTIGRLEGLPGFYRGFLPTAMQIMPFSGAQFASYKLFKGLWVEYFDGDHVILRFPGAPPGTDGLHLKGAFACGAASGCVAKFLVYPFDLIRKRLQIRGFEHARGSAFGSVPRYEGFLHCVTHTMENERFTAFYKGLVPSLFKATLTTALNFWLYETVLAFLQQEEDDK